MRATSRVFSFASGSAQPLALTLLVLLSGGCGQTDGLALPARHPVEGKVVYRGKAAQGFRVTFHPLGDIGEVKFAPSAITAEDGTFRLRSYEPDDGAPAGDYAVTLEWPDHLNKAEDLDPKPEVDRLRGAYSDPQRSKFKVTVAEGENQLQQFVVQ